MLTHTFSSTLFDGYTAGIFAWLAYGRSGNYIVAGLAGAVALSAFRIQRLIRRHQWRRAQA
ncbi:hypothetical protein ABKY47_002032 [Aeromonas hydrophila]